MGTFYTVFFFLWHSIFFYPTNFNLHFIYNTLSEGLVRLIIRHNPKFNYYAPMSPQEQEIVHTDTYKISPFSLLLSKLITSESVTPTFSNEQNYLHEPQVIYYSVIFHLCTHTYYYKYMYKIYNYFVPFFLSYESTVFSF